MNYQHQRHGLRATSLSVGVALALAAGVAAAQEATAPDQGATTLDRIEVTGTRIRQVDVETAQPVFIMSREDIERQGFQSVADILQSLPVVGTPPISRASPLSSGENIGGQYVQMRNLTANRTLVLVNGRRLGSNTTGLQDISILPTTAIERVEVLKDGASSIYGSDAIAGVINFITRSGFEGATATAYYGQYTQGDGDVTRGSFLMGFNGDRGSLTTAVEYRKEAEVWSADRPFSAYPQGSRHPTRGWTTVSQWGAIVLPAALGGTRVLDQGADWRDIANYHPINSDTGQPTQATGGAGSPIDKSNTNQQTMLRTPVQSTSLFVNAHYDFTPSVRFRGDMLYSQREAESTVAGYPFQTATVTGPLAGLQMSADSYYNPLGVHHGYEDPRAVSFNRRTWELPRTDTLQRDAWRFNSVLEGEIEWGDRYLDWDVGYMYTQNRQVQNNVGNLNIFNVARAVGPSFYNSETGRVECGTADNPIPYGAGAQGCVPWNPFIPFGRVGDGGLTGDTELQNYLFQETKARGKTETTMFTANVAGSLMHLPAGDLGFAVGLEHRKEKGEFVPDALAVNGLVTNLAAGPTKGGYSVDEAYLEVFVPLLANIAGAEELSLTAASRYSDYDTFGDTTNNKFGLKWKPVDSVMVRGTLADGFRAPTIANLYGGGSQTFSFFTDPCDTQFGASASSSAVRARCAQDIADADNFRQLAQGFNPAANPNAQTPVPFNSASNPELGPETSRSKAVGLVWSPGFIDGLSVAVDWWNVRVGNTIVSDTATQMLNDCYVEGIADRCTSFTRDPTLGYVNNLTFANRNAGYIEVEGFDVDMRYRRPVAVGSLSASWQTTYTTKNEFKTTDDPNVLPQQNVSFGNNFRIQSMLNIGWENGDWGVNWIARYFSSMKETCLHAVLFPEECSDPDYVAANPAQTAPTNRVGSNTFHDVRVRWQAPWRASISIGANNVFNHYGPPMYTQPSSNVSYQGQFDIGRFVYMEYQQQF